MLKKLLAPQSFRVTAESLIWHVFIFAIPFQTRIILKTWGNSFNEWNSAFLYGTDILLAMIFILCLTRKVVQRQRGNSFLRVPSKKTLFPRSLSGLFFLFFLIICGLSLTVADNLGLGFYRLIKILEFVWLYYYIQSSLGPLGNLVSKWRGSFLAVTISGFFQAVIAIGQSLLQHSLGLKWLGESVLRTNFNAVAAVSLEGEKFLRAYGTLPHPNILAAWLFVAIFAFYFLYLYHRQRPINIIGQERRGYTQLFLKIRQLGHIFQVYRKSRVCTSKAPRDVFILVIYPILLWGFFTTFSRIAIGLWVAGILVRLLVIWIKKEKYKLDPIFKKRLCLLFIITVAVAGIFYLAYRPQVHSRIFISGQEQAVSQRILYAKMAGEIALDRPWLGVGLGQFVSTLQSSFKNYPAYFYQPAHNIYLLILDETGFFGLAAFISWLIILSIEYYRQTKFKEPFHFSFFTVFFSVLVMGFFDHFLWTLQQGQLIFWLTMGLISSLDLSKNVVRFKN